MPRVSPRLLVLLGALLLALWVASPMSSSPTPVTRIPADAATLVPELDAVNDAVDRLEARLARPIRPDAPDRDPFRFAPTPAAAASPADRPSAAARPAASAPPIVWPTLVAILSAGSDASTPPRAVFEDAAAVVHIQAVGDTLAGVTVSTIAADTVTVVHTASGRSTTLSLR